VLVVRFELYRFRSDLNYIFIYLFIYLVKFEFFLAKKYTVWAVGTVAAPINRFVGAAGTVAVPTYRFCRGGWC